MAKTKLAAPEQIGSSCVGRVNAEMHLGNGLTPTSAKKNQRASKKYLSRCVRENTGKNLANNNVMRATCKHPFNLVKSSSCILCTRS